MKKLLRVIWYFVFFIPGIVLAEQGIGNVAQNLIEPVTVLSDFVSTASIIIGVSFIFASLIKYMQYRVNPLAVPLSTVIMLLIMGIMLVCLPLAYKLTEGGIPYSYSVKL